MCKGLEKQRWKAIWQVQAWAQKRMNSPPPPKKNKLTNKNKNKIGINILQGYNQMVCFYFKWMAAKITKLLVKHTVYHRTTGDVVAGTWKLIGTVWKDLSGNR